MPDDATETCGEASLLSAIQKESCPQWEASWRSELLESSRRRDEKTQGVKELFEQYTKELRRGWVQSPVGTDEAEEPKSAEDLQKAGRRLENLSPHVVGPRNKLYAFSAAFDQLHQRTLALCKRFAKAESAAATGGYAKRLSGKVAQLCEEPDLVEESWPETTPAPSAPSKTSAKGRSVALRKADRAAPWNISFLRVVLDPSHPMYFCVFEALEKAAMASGARLELVEADSTSIAKAFRACVELRPWIEEDAERLDMLGASFLAYADEHCDEKLPRWSSASEEEDL
eukprot:g32900.t1